ncbi:MAG: DUF3313 domain-containing protein [Proteobacteria bacterium]|nr:DUF3313 domain-containing protein [Pseudomonadota bacterium]
MNIRKIVICAAVASTALLFSSAQADELIYSGFMSDYTQLEKVTDGSADYRYLAPDATNRMIKYNAVMIDQPEIFIANDSQYRGVKPKHLNALAESLRAGLAAGLGEHVYVVDRPMENVLYLSVAITNLKLHKIKKKPYNYVPVAFVVGKVKGAATSDIAKKANFDGLVFELEAFDSVSEERLVALIDHFGGVTEEPESWEDVDALMIAYGELIACRFNNARLPVEQRVDCLAAD